MPRAPLHIFALLLFPQMTYILVLTWRSWEVGYVSLNTSGKEENSIQCLFLGWMFECLWPLHFPSATGKKAATGCEVVSACVRPYWSLAEKCLFFHICIRFRQEIRISWGWGSHGDSLKQNVRSLENVKINQGETNWS